MDSERIKINQLLKDTSNPTESEKKKSTLSLKNAKPVGILILLSGGLHNLIDGIAIGVAFASKKVSLIVSTNIAILLHEIPKELGDAGMLISANFTSSQVLFWNAFNNIGCIFGIIIGVAIGEMSEAANSYSLGFVAGNFYYIALVEMVPEIMKVKGWKNHLSQFIFMSLGIGIMFLILLAEDDH